MDYGKDIDYRQTGLLFDVCAWLPSITSLVLTQKKAAAMGYYGYPSTRALAFVRVGQTPRSRILNCFRLRSNSVL